MTAQSKYTTPNQTVKQTNILTQGRYDITATEMNIFICLLYEMKRKGFNGLYYSLDIDELVKINNDKKQHILDAAKSLMNRHYEKIEMIDNIKKTTICSFISSAEFFMGKLEIGLDQKILSEYIKISNNYTEYEIRTALQASSKYTKRIYQILSQFKNAPPATGSQYPNYFVDINEFKKILGVLDERTGKDKFVNFGVFRSNVLEVAKAELERLNSDLKFNWFVAQKSGKRVTHLRFEIIYLKSNDQIFINDEAERQYNLLINTYKLSDWQVRIILKNCSIKDIKETVFLLWTKISDPHNPINNIGGYSAQVFDQKFNLNLINNNNINQTNLF